MKKKIKIIDSFEIKDSKNYGINGIVSLKDDKGNIIFKKQNMIVEGGRTAILKSFRGQSSGKIIGGVIKFGSGSSSSIVVYPSDESLGNAISSLDTDLTANNVNFDFEERTITINIELNPNSSELISELGIFLTDITMFSRVIFEEVSLISGTSYTLEYIIYF